MKCENEIKLKKCDSIIMLRKKQQLEAALRILDECAKPPIEANGVMYSGAAAYAASALRAFIQIEKVRYAVK